MNKKCLKNAKHTKYAKNIYKNTKRGCFLHKDAYNKEYVHGTKMEIKVKWRT